MFLDCDSIMTWSSWFPSADADAAQLSNVKTRMDRVELVKSWLHTHGIWGFDAARFWCTDNVVWMHLGMLRTFGARRFDDLICFVH
jgi:hypothetical protein